ncbi:opposite strand transcription unit to Stag3, putative [Acanthamoeba castellanii str. Neff]|uniref:Opposite strand transcription unit to Stag3, putative n=1 Tax=Acanthamoeba castellanii (strain ATCC 30010 / Neff) TaxID=1257118 RepID=L8HAK5_ACACF|nr:opposite strand transcription unit to Stag3, putative [Acanthamoeba castellanii str. Neff]ELR22215.1 opposite strand transcription unit to Stag3, putative [Acanthamoeba castellanii str. Neff]
MSWTEECEATLTVLPGRLLISRLHEETLHQTAAPLLRLLLVPGSHRLLSLTRTRDDLYKSPLPHIMLAVVVVVMTMMVNMTLIADEEAFDVLPPGVVEVVVNGPSSTGTADASADRSQWQRWRAMQVASGGSGQPWTGAGGLSGPLAAAGITIFYLGTAEEDILLVPEDKLPAALAALRGKFEIVTEGISASTRRDAAAAAADVPTSLSPPALSRKKKLAFPRLELSLCGVPEEDVAAATYLPWDRREDCFVSYTELEGEVSLIGDSASLRQYSFPVEGSREPWAIIKVDEGPLGFEEAGIVASLAVPLGQAGLPLFYLSTFLTDYAFVHKASLPRARQALKDSPSFLLPL